MIAVYGRPSLWARLRPVFSGFDLPLLAVVLALSALGMVTMYSVGYDHAAALSTMAATCCWPPS